MKKSAVIGLGIGGLALLGVIGAAVGDDEQPQPSVVPVVVEEAVVEPSETPAEPEVAGVADEPTEETPEVTETLVVEETQAPAPTQAAVQPAPAKAEPTPTKAAPAPKKEEPKSEPKSEPAPAKPAASCSSDQYNCSDFSTCAEAKAVFNSCPSDIHRLDRDNNGVPCESLCS